MSIVHCKRDGYDVYIGRKSSGMHFGNPFSHLSYGLGLIKVATRAESIARFRSWLEGTTDCNVEPARRQWILDNIRSLRGKRLGCYCAPLACHGTVLEEYATI